MDSEKAFNVSNFPQPQLCSNGCGFFGSPSTKNLCSKCYNNFLKQEIIMVKSTKTAVSSTPDKLVSCPKTTTVSVSSSTYDDDDDDDEIIVAADAATASTSVVKDDDDKRTPKKKNRCESCNKKVGLLGFECRCGGVFCGVHRYAEKHSCTFDFKVVGRDVLAKENPICVADKQKDRI